MSLIRYHFNDCTTKARNVTRFKFQSYMAQIRKITRFKLILEMKFSSSAANARADALNMDIREVQTNITASKSGFETSQFLQRGQPLRSHVWGWPDDFRLLRHLKFQNEIQHFWSLLHSAAGTGADHRPFIKCWANLITFSILDLTTKNLANIIFGKVTR